MYLSAKEPLKPLLPTGPPTVETFNLTPDATTTTTQPRSAVRDEKPKTGLSMRNFFRSQKGWAIVLAVFPFALILLARSKFNMPAGVALVSGVASAIMIAIAYAADIPAIGNVFIAAMPFLVSVAFLLLRLF